MATINRGELLQRLQSVKAGLSPNPNVEQSNSFLFRKGSVVTYNGEVRCKTKIPGMDKSYVGAIKSKSFLAVLERMVEEEIDFEYNDSEVTIKGKRRKNIVAMESEISSPLDSVDFPTEWVPLHADFTEGVALVHECAGSDVDKEYLTCVHIHPKWVEATNNNQLARYRMKTGVKSPVLVRKKSIRHITSLDMTELSETASWVHFRNPTGLLISCRKFAAVGEYKDMGSFLEVEGDEVSLPKGVADAADAAMVFSEENADKNKILVELKEGKIRISGEGFSGRCSEVLSLKRYHGKPMKFTIPPKLLVEISKRYTDCVINPERLKVDGGRFTFVTCLGSIWKE